MLAAQVDRLLVDVAVGESGRASYQLWARGPEPRRAATRAHPAGRLRAGGRVSRRRPGGAWALRRRSAVGSAADSGSRAGGPPGRGRPPRAAQGGRLAHRCRCRRSPPLWPRVEVRVIVPGGRSYELVEKARAGQVSAPPGTVARKPVTGLGGAGQLPDELLPSGPGGSLGPPENALAFFHVPPASPSSRLPGAPSSATPAPLSPSVSRREKEKTRNGFETVFPLHGVERGPELRLVAGRLASCWRWPFRGPRRAEAPRSEITLPLKDYLDAGRAGGRRRRRSGRGGRPPARRRSRRWSPSRCGSPWGKRTRPR